MMMKRESDRFCLAVPVFDSYTAEVTGRLDEQALETHVLYRAHDIDFVDRMYIDAESLGGE